MLTNDEALKIKKMVDQLEDLYYNLGRDYVIARDAEACVASHVFVEYVESLTDPHEVLDQSVTEYHESKYH
jgi:hypothetical protein